MGEWIILNLGSRRRPVVSFTLRPPAALEKELGTLEYEAVRGSRTLWKFWRKENLFPMPLL
jgi:hypothetical protein